MSAVIDSEYIHKAVTPCIESVPVRHYILRGKFVDVYEFVGWEHKTHYVFKNSDKPIYTIDAHTEKQAQALMNDLYYGE